MPTVSVLLPDAVPASLESIRRQTIRDDVEVVGSLETATGDYLLLLPPGDELDPHALEVLLARTGRDVDLVQGGFISTGPDGARTRFRLREAIGRYERALAPAAEPWFRTLPVAVGAALVRRELVREHEIDLPADLPLPLGLLAWHVLVVSVAQTAAAVDYPVIRRGADHAAPASGYERVRDVLRPRGERVVAELLLHELVALGRRPELLDETAPRREIAAASRRAAATTATGWTGDGRFDDWLRLLLQTALPDAVPTSPLRGAARRATVAAGRAAAELASRGLAGRALRIAGRRAGARGIAPLPSIPQPRGPVGRNALVVVPWSDENGSTRIIDALNDALVELGYQLHIVVSNDLGSNAQRAGWGLQEFYDLAVSPDFGRLRVEDGRVVPDGLRVDDWVGDDLRQFVADADRAWSFDVVVCHYVFFSAVLELVNPDATTLLVAHDRFAGRNSRFAAAGMTDSFFFSTDEEQEAVGLRRADHVIALQDRETEYFRGLVDGDATVDTLPFLDAPRFSEDHRKDGPLRIGYIGSDYRNNRTALLDFFEAVKGHDLSGLRFVIAGRVAGTVAAAQLPDEVELRGPVDDLADFYASVDVVFSPDFVESGRKIKVFEGMSFGVPVVTTAASTAGFDDLPDDMRLTSSEQILARLLELAAAPEALTAARTAARAAYTRLTERYDTRAILAAMLGD